MRLSTFAVVIAFLLSPLTSALGQAKTIAERLGYPPDSKLSSSMPTILPSLTPKTSPASMHSTSMPSLPPA